MAAAGQEHEPRLRYGPLGSESPRESAKPQHAASPATRLCVSDKVLAVGHRDGSVQLLDHLGNQARAGVRPMAPQRPRGLLSPAVPPLRRLLLLSPAAAR